MWNVNVLTRLLKIDYPLIQGPFGGGFSTAELTASVSNVGGLGSFGAHNLNPEGIRAKVSEIKSLTSHPFAMNLWVSSAETTTPSPSRGTYTEIATHYRNYFSKFGLQPPTYPEKFGEDFESQVEALIEAAPPVFSFVFGIPSAQILARCRSKGIVTIGAATTLDEALAVEAAGVDAVVLSGLEAGGHRPSFLRSAEESLTGLGALVSVVAEKVKIPLIAAGGIADARGCAATRLLGAQGFQLGTAFLACAESGASSVHKEIIFSPRARNTTLSRSYTGRLARFIENDFLKAMRESQTPYLPYPAQNYFLGELKKVSALAGDCEVTPLYAGQSASLVVHRHAKDLMAALVRGIPEILGE